MRKHTYTILHQTKIRTHKLKTYAITQHLNTKVNDNHNHYEAILCHIYKRYLHTNLRIAIIHII